MTSCAGKPLNGLTGRLRGWHEHFNGKIGNNRYEVLVDWEIYEETCDGAVTRDMHQQDLPLHRWMKVEEKSVSGAGRSIAEGDQIGMRHRRSCDHMPLRMWLARLRVVADKERKTVRTCQNCTTKFSNGNAYGRHLSDGLVYEAMGLSAFA